MKTSIQNLSLLILIFAFVQACKVDPAIPKTREGAPVFGISFNVPPGWPEPVYNYQSNILSDEGFRLGRKLFYDTRLSRDNTISCGSCHQDFAAFAHSAHSLSHGIDGLFGTRNAPALFNLNWHPNFMWDGGVNHIEVQPLAPIINPVEMDETMENVIIKLKKTWLINKCLQKCLVTTPSIRSAFSELLHNFKVCWYLPIPNTINMCAASQEGFYQKQNKEA